MSSNFHSSNSVLYFSIPVMYSCIPVFYSSKPSPSGFLHIPVPYINFPFVSSNLPFLPFRWIIFPPSSFYYLSSNPSCLPVFQYCIPVMSSNIYYSSTRSIFCVPSFRFQARRFYAACICHFLTSFAHGVGVPRAFALASGREQILLFSAWGSTRWRHLPTRR